MQLGQRLTYNQTTRAGVAVAKLKGNPNKEIALLAAEIVAKWKKTVQSKPKPNMSAGSPPKATTPTTKVTGKESFKGDVSKRKWNSEDVDTKRTGMPSRDACIGLLYNGLAFMSTESPTNLVNKSVEVEKAAHDILDSTTPEYRSKLRSLFQNLKANLALGTGLMSGEILPSKFIVMTDEELKSSERKKKDEELAKDNMKRAQVPMAEKSISDALQCGKCKQKKVSYSQAQTRSADEPMTTFCECTVCGNRWKVCSSPCVFRDWLISVVLLNFEILPASMRRIHFTWYFMDGFGGAC